MTVVDMELVRRFPYADGRVFGEVGDYEQIDGQSVTFTSQSLGGDT